MSSFYRGVTGNKESDYTQRAVQLKEKLDRNEQLDYYDREDLKKIQQSGLSGPKSIVNNGRW